MRARSRRARRRARIGSRSTTSCCASPISSATRRGSQARRSSAVGKWLLVVALVACNKGDKADAPAKQEPPAARAKPAWLAGVELPQVTDGFEPVHDPGHVVTLSMTELLLDSKPVITV